MSIANANFRYPSYQDGLDAIDTSTGFLRYTFNTEITASRFIGNVSLWFSNELKNGLLEMKAIISYPFQKDNYPFKAAPKITCYEIYFHIPSSRLPDYWAFSQEIINRAVKNGVSKVNFPERA